MVSLLDCIVVCRYRRRCNLECVCILIFFVMFVTLKRTTIVGNRVYLSESKIHMYTGPTYYLLRRLLVGSATNTAGHYLTQLDIT